MTKTQGRVLRRFVLFAVLALVSRAAVLGIAIVDLDESVYAVAAREMLRGRLLYAEVADHKPPLVFVYYALGQLLFGHSLLGLRLATHLITVPLTALLASAFFDHDRRGLLAGVAWLLYGAAFIGHDMLAMNCELLMMLPLAAALVVSKKALNASHWPRLVAVGVLIGVASLFKYQAAAWIGVPLLAMAASDRNDRWRNTIHATVAIGAGFVLPWLASLWVFAALGGGRAFVYWNFLHNLGYIGATVRPWEAALRAAAAILPFLAVTAPLWIGLGRLRSDSMLPHARALIFAALAASALTAALGLRFYSHYLVPLYLPLALGAAPWLARVAEAPRSRTARTVLGWTVFVLAGFSASTVVLYHGRSNVYVETRSVFPEMARQIQSHACRPDGGLFVWGFAPQFYYEAQRPVASRFLMVGYTLVGHVSGRRGGDSDPRLIRSEHWDWLMADLDRNRPDFVVDTSRARLSRWSYPMEEFPRLWRFIQDGYHPIVAFEGVTLWRRRGCGETPVADGAGT